MSMINECRVLVDELRNDPAFKEALKGLRDAIADAIANNDTPGVAARYADMAENLVEVVGWLEAQR